MVLFLQHWFHLSPAISNPILDGLCYLLAFRSLGWQFAKYALAATASFSASYSIWECFPPLFPGISQLPLLAAIIGGLFVGVGVGIVVRVGGACGGDDALALTISKATALPIARAYLFTDLTVLALSISYLPITRIGYSLITVTISSFLIGRIQSANITHVACQTD